MKKDKQFLYLTTVGHKSGEAHEIEIWFVAHDDKHYIVAERRDNAHWVQNIRRNPRVSFWVHDTIYEGTGRVVNAEAESALVRAVSALMDAKYNWSNGLIVELSAD